MENETRRLEEVTKNEASKGDEKSIGEYPEDIDADEDYYDEYNQKAEERKIIIFVTIACIIVIILVLALGYDIGRHTASDYYSGYSAGCKDGKETGYEAGYETGYTNGVYEGIMIQNVIDIIVLNDNIPYDIREEGMDKFYDLMENPSEEKIHEFLDEFLDYVDEYSYIIQGEVSET